MAARPPKALMFAILGTLGPMAWGQGVGGDSPVHTLEVLVPVGSIPEDPTNWLGKVGLPDAPVRVELDPRGPTWLAEFWEPTTSISYPLIHIEIEEHLVVEGDLPWTGWEVNIVTEGFGWNYQGISPPFLLLVDGLRAPGLDVQIIGSLVTASFDPLPAGTSVEILARLAYSGASATDIFELRQYPIPEPTTLCVFFLLVPAITRR